MTPLGLGFRVWCLLFVTFFSGGGGGGERLIINKRQHQRSFCIRRRRLLRPATVVLWRGIAVVTLRSFLLKHLHAMAASSASTPCSIHPSPTHASSASTPCSIPPSPTHNRATGIPHAGASVHLEGFLHLYTHKIKENHPQTTF